MLYVACPSNHVTFTNAHEMAATSTTGARTLAAALCGLFTSPLYNNIARVRGAEFSPDSLSTAVEQALGPLALVLGLMGFALR